MWAGCMFKHMQLQLLGGILILFFQKKHEGPGVVHPGYGLIGRVREPFLGLGEVTEVAAGEARCRSTNAGCPGDNETTFNLLANGSCHINKRIHVHREFNR